MTYRYVSLVFGLSTLLLGACTIVHEPSHPPPPPPPPPGHDQGTTETGTPGATGTAEPARKMMNAGALRKLIIAEPPAEGDANLIVQVVDGTCVVKVDEEDYGDTAAVNATVAAGEHVVSCTPAEGDAQSHNVKVEEGGQPTTVIFSVKVASQSHVVPPPPVGRPETTTQ